MTSQPLYILGKSPGIRDSDAGPVARSTGWDGALHKGKGSTGPSMLEENQTVGSSIWDMHDYPGLGFCIVFVRGSRTLGACIF